MTKTMIATIDFKASSRDGCPIEVGIALWAPGSPGIRAWSSLIRPTGEWMDDEGLWDDEAWRVHGITQAALFAEGRNVTDVAERLNDLLEGAKAHGRIELAEAGYAARLYRSAGVHTTWRLGSLREMVLAGCGDVCSARSVLSRICRADSTIRRAGPEAVRILRELASERHDQVALDPAFHELDLTPVRAIEAERRPA